MTDSKKWSRTFGGERKIGPARTYIPFFLEADFMRTSNLTSLSLKWA